MKTEPKSEMRATVHPSPVRARIGPTAVAAIPFGIVLVSGQFFSIAAEYWPLRAAWLQRAR